MTFIKLFIALAGLGLVGSALLALAMMWQFMWIVYALIAGGFLLQIAREI